MLKKYKNHFLEIIKEELLNPELFSISEETDNDFQTFCIKYGNTPFYFKARNFLNNFHYFDYSYIQFNADFSTIDFIYRHIDDFKDINIIYDEFRVWLNNHIKEYLDELLLPDLWTQLEEQKKLSFNFESSDNNQTNFSEEEQILLRQGIHTLKHLVITEFNPNDEEIKLIDERLDYLCESVDRLNRFDWKSVFINTILSISITLSLDTEKGKYLFELAKKALAIGLSFLK